MTLTRGLKNGWKHNLSPILSSTLHSIKKHYGKFIIIALTHLLFIFFLSLVMTTIQWIALDHLSAVFEMGGDATGGVSKAIEDPGIFKDLQGMTLTDAFSFHMKRLVFLLVVMILAGYLLWVVFQGFAWWLAHATVKWQKFWRFMGRFALKSLFFYIFFVLAGYVWIRLFLSSQMSPYPWVGEGVLRGFLWVADILVAYFAVFCFTLTGKPWKDIKASFKLGTRLWSFLMVVLIILGFVVIDLLLYIPLPFTVRIIVGVVLVMSALSFAQIFLIRTKEHVWDTHKDASRVKKHSLVKKHGVKHRPADHVHVKHLGHDKVKKKD